MEIGWVVCGEKSMLELAILSWQWGSGCWMIRKKPLIDAAKLWKQRPQNHLWWSLKFNAFGDREAKSYESEYSENLKMFPNFWKSRNNSTCDVLQTSHQSCSRSFGNHQSLKNSTSVISLGKWWEEKRRREQIKKGKISKMKQQCKNSRRGSLGAWVRRKRQSSRGITNNGTLLISKTIYEQACYRWSSQRRAFTRATSLAILIWFAPRFLLSIDWAYS